MNTKEIKEFRKKWSTPKRFEGTYGSTGFYLDFSDPDDLGADRSGNNQHFTPNGFVSASSSFYTHSLEGRLCIMVYSFKTHNTSL